VFDLLDGSTPRVAGHFSGTPVEQISDNGTVYNLLTGLTGGSGQDVIAGTDSAETLSGGGGSDGLYANGDDDVLDGGAANDLLEGGSGADTLTGGDGDDTVDGGASDVLSLDSIATLVSGARDGDDAVLDMAGGGSVRIQDQFATAVSVVEAVFAPDSPGLRLSSAFAGPAGGDLLLGTDSNNFFGAGAGDDLIVGGSGAGNDVLDGGTGIDTVTYASATAPVGVDLSVNLANDGQGGFDTLFGIENIIGGSGGGALVGNDGANAITGGAGNDRLAGRAGADTLDGGDGGDTLSGGAGNDTVLGGAGNDALYGFDESAVPRSLADTGVFPEIAKLVAIGDLPSPGDGALGIVADDTSLGGFDVIAKLTYVGGIAGYANTVGVYTVAADDTIGPVSVAFQDAQALSPGDMANVAVPGSGSDFGLFLIVHGARLNSGYQGLDFETGTLSFVHDLDGAGERAAKITDSGTDLSLVFEDGETQTVLQGPVVHSTERGGATVLNADNTVHVAAGRLSAGNETTLRVGFEDLPGGGDSDFNDVIVDVEILPDMAPATDTLGGGAGNDTLTGGLGGDVFVFGAGGGTDRITDFEVGSDVFDLQDGVTIATVDADSDGFTDDTLVTLFDGAVELIGVTGITEADLLGA